jgi:glycosyltransferase involved in cell wall biosynthesis
MISLYLPGDSKIGSGYQAHYMANAMTRRGHEVTMFSPCGRPDDAAYRHRRVDPGKRFRTFGFAWALRREGLDGYDAVHAHGDDYWLWGRRYSPHVRTMHGSCLAEALHVPGWREKLRMAGLGLSEVLATRVADETVNVSADTARWYPWTDRVIPNGVDLEVFCPGQKAAEPTVLFVGTYRNRKRGALLHEVFCEVVRPAVPGARLWMVCGDAPGGEGIEVLGRLSTPDLAERFRRAWVFSLPSTYEGFGVPYIEAMASGTAVVATPNPGAVEVLDDGRYGRLVGDEALGEAIVELLGDAERRRAMERVGLERAGMYGWPAVVAGYESVYDAIADRRLMNPGQDAASKRGRLQRA